MSYSNLGRFLRDSIAPIFYFWKIIDVFTFVFAFGAGPNVEGKSFSLFPQNVTQRWQLNISGLFQKIPGKHSGVWQFTWVCVLAIPSSTNHAEVLMATMLLTCVPQESPASFPSQVPSGLLHLAFLLAAPAWGLASPTRITITSAFCGGWRCWRKHPPHLYQHRLSHYKHEEMLAKIQHKLIHNHINELESKKRKASQAEAKNNQSQISEQELTSNGPQGWSSWIKCYVLGSMRDEEVRQQALWLVKGLVIIFLHRTRSLENCPFSKMKTRKLPPSPHKSGPMFPGYEWDRSTWG